MSDLFFDWNDSCSLGLESPNTGIPIPRSQHSQQYLKSEFGGCLGYLYDNDCSSPSPRQPQPPPNSLVMNAGSTISSSPFAYNLDLQRGALSPLSSAESPLVNSPQTELDMEIKMEPLEDILDFGTPMDAPGTHNPPEDNLLDNVNFEDLLMTDDMDSSTPCLDPQHSSPAAMATVHPDEVLGMMRSDVLSSHSNYTHSINVPTKAENPYIGGCATSFPPHGIGWRDAGQPQSVPNQSIFLGSFSNFHGTHNPRAFLRESLSTLPSRLLILKDEFNSLESLTPKNNNNEPVYTQLESAPSPTNSTLHNLLVGSPSSRSPQQHFQQQQRQMSPYSSNPSLVPVSPLRGMSQDIPIGQSVPGALSFLAATSGLNVSSRLSSSAPVNNLSPLEMFHRNDNRQHLLSTGSLAEEGSTSSLSTGVGGVLSPMPPDLSIDEGIDSEDDSDAEHYDSDSDNDSIMSEEMSVGTQNAKKERHFWQYNVQAKGPKGQRVTITQGETNPHHLDEIMDPVFSPLCSIQGIKHSGKARRGDGNDLTPSPHKLVNIGIELSKLNKKINEMTPVSELPSTIRSKSRKEKNKLASRACRLKKKAQHEANKIKLHGLEQEHKGMIALITRVKDDLLKKVDIASNSSSDVSHQPDSSSFDPFSSYDSSRSNGRAVGDAQMQVLLTTHIEKAARMRTKQRIAGFTTEFVNKVIENCRSGNPKGGLDELAQTFVKTSSPISEVGGLNYNNELYT